MIDKLNNNKLFEGFYPNGQLSFRFYMKEIKEILKPEYTYEHFYLRFFGGTMERDFLSKLKDNFKEQKKFLSKLGFKELLNEDELLLDISRDGNYISCKSYFDNGHLKFKYSFDKDEDYKIEKCTEEFELFYRDCQPKFRFSYDVDEDEGATGGYQAFYNNGQLKEEGNLSYSDSSFVRFSKKGQIRESYNDSTYYKNHDNGKVHYWITLKDGRKQGPYEIYDRFGELIEKGVFKNDEMRDGPYESYFEDGQIDKKCFFKNGVLDGPYESYFDDGHIHIKCHYKNGVLDSSYQENYVNGCVKKTAFYSNGVLDGPYQEFYATKGVKENTFYIKGERMDMAERA